MTGLPRSRSVPSTTSVGTTLTADGCSRREMPPAAAMTFSSAAVAPRYLTLIAAP